MKIDSHQHFWTYDPIQFPWIGPEHTTIKRHFYPEDLRPLLQASGIDGCIAVQARQSIKETDWLLELTEQNDFIRGVIGWLPMSEPTLEDYLDRYSSCKRLVGLRHIVHDEPDDAFILRPDFNDGIKRLADQDLAYDILIFEKHLPATIEFVDRHPNQVFVVDHIAKPVIKEAAFDTTWRTNLIELARRENVSCKLSGMVTEVRDERWTPELLRPYFETVLEAFGPNRLLFGSDWPVCLLRTQYAHWIEVVRNYAHQLSSDEQASLWGANAIRIYGVA